MNRINTTLLIVLGLLLVAKSAVAEVLRWPQGCLSGELHVTNSNTFKTSAWLQKMKPSLVSETEVQLSPESVTKILVSAKTTSERFSLLHFTTPSSVTAQFKCKTKNFTAHSFEGGLLTYRRSDLLQNVVWLQNLFSAENLATVELLDRRFNVLSSSTVLLKSLSQKNFTVLDQTRNWVYLRISAVHRFAAFNTRSLGADGPAFIASQKSVVPEAAYFEVRSKDNMGDSFIAKISDPALIEEARKQIANPSLEKILFAKIAKGHSGTNRNWSKKEKPFWSWSISEVTNINDLASTSCNGLPQAVEDRVDTWVKNPGRICFWSYRIRRELKSSEVAAGESIQ